MAFKKLLILAALLIALGASAAERPIPPGQEAPTIVTDTDGTPVRAGDKASNALRVKCVSGCSGGSSGSGGDVNITGVGGNTVTTMVPVDASGATVPVSGPLTDTELRASAVPVDASGATVPVSGPLTDAQLRASAVPVDGSGVTQPVSAAALPVPTGLTSITTGQTAVTGSATQLSNVAGKVVCIKVKDGGTQNVYYGPSGVSTSTGMELIPGEGVCRSLDNLNRLFVIAGGVGSTVAYEVYQ